MPGLQENMADIKTDEGMIDRMFNQGLTLSGYYV
jgi:hypothetical protein